MRKLYLFILVFVVFVFQYSVLGVFLKESRIPNLFVALTVSLALLFGFSNSVSWIIFSGLLMDSMAPWNIGSGILALVLVLWIVESLKVVTEFRSRRYFFVFLFAVLTLLATLFFDLALNLELAAEKYLFQVAGRAPLVAGSADYFLKLAYASLLGMAVYYFARRAAKRPPLPVISRPGHGMRL